MPVFIALYRGINVGGRHAVKMEALRAIHERLGHVGVQTYIQSGNVVFSAKGAAAGLSRAAETEFAERFGFPARITVVSAKQWTEFVDANPFARFAAEDPKTVHAGFCDGRPNATALKDLLTRTGGRETFEIGNGILYVHAPDGFGMSKFAAGMERASGVSMTVRNWRTVEAVQELIGSAG